MLSNMDHLYSQSKIWIETGTASKKHYIDICKIYEQFGTSVCKALAGFHSTTGCDYNPCFYRKAKRRPFNIMSKSEKYQQAFYDLGNSNFDQEKIFEILETYVCHLYGVGITKRISFRKVNDIRFSLFNRQYKLNDVNEPLFKKKLKNFDASSLPPSQSELHQHLLRGRYITNIWLNAHKKVPTELVATEHGWELGEDNSYKFKWFEGPQMPESVQDILLDNELDDEIEDAIDVSESDENDSSDDNNSDDDYSDD